MSQISVISKLTGVETKMEGTQVTLSHSSIVELHVERASVSHFARSGNDLLVTLHSGEVITVKNFYVTDAQGVSQLVLQDSNGALWWIEDPAGAATYESIASTNVLLAASGSDAGGAAFWPWALGGIVAAGGIAAAASTGGGGGDGGNNNSTNPNIPVDPADPDTTPPNAPSGIKFSSDGKTVTGTAEPGSTITLKDANGNVVGTGKTGSDGNFTVSLGTPLTNGEQVTATATDNAGNTSPGTTLNAPDITAPDAPTIGSVIDDIAPQTGTVSNGGSTNDQRPQLTGTGEAGSTVTIYDGGVAIGTAIVASNGTWTFTPSVDLSESTHQITVKATDAAGNTGPASPVFTLTVDLTPPDAPTAIVLTDDTGLIRGTITSGAPTDASLPLLAGTGEPGGTITIYDNGVAIGTTTVQPNGTWSVTPNAPLPDGTHSITVTETDAAGNQSTASAPVTFTVDTTPPSAPGNLVVSNDGGTISGIAEPGSTVTIREGGALVGNPVVADSQGNFSLTLTPPKLNGEILTADATDTAGNTSPTTSAAAPDITPPQTPVIISVIDDVQATTGPVGPNGITNDRAPTVNGTGEAGSTITISNSSDVLGTVVVPSSGQWSFTPPTPLTDGTYVLTATATDAAGNLSGISTAWTINVDGTAPDVPVISQVVDDVPGGIVGLLGPNATTNDATPTLSGTAEANATISLRVDGVEIGTTVADGLGAWTFTPSSPIGEGPHALTAVSTDAAGNTSGVSNTWTLTIDSVAPAAPVITQVLDDVPERLGALNPNDSTNDTTPTLNGTAEPGSTVTIRLDGTVLGTAPVDNNGVWTYTPTVPLGEGPHTFTVVATDAAGNTSQPSSGFTLTVDTTPPTAATIATVTDDVGGVQGPLTSGDTTDDTQPLLQGSAPADAVITVYDGTTLLGTASLDGSGGWSFTPVTPLTDGPHSLTVHATDAAGNTTISSPFVLTVDTVAPATPDIPAITVNPDGGTTQTPLNPGEITRDTTPTLSGTGTAGDTVTIYGNGVKIGDAVVDSAGNWSWTPPSPLAGGTYDITLTVTNVDGTGNESAPSQPVTITIDTDPPAPPAAPIVTDSVTQITGPVPDGGTTNDPRPVLSGTGTPNDVINITDTVNGG
ncbi:Ig-like domain-containing protein, partial [Enterobacter sp. C6]|uniref:Ig-like domain-containing protein n=1 Tax=Enterobacter sp. C6 TaxID=1299469 RepID=UPI0011E6CB7D